MGELLPTSYPIWLPFLYALIPVLSLGWRPHWPPHPTCEE